MGLYFLHTLWQAISMMICKQKYSSDIYLILQIDLIIVWIFMVETRQVWTAKIQKNIYILGWMEQCVCSDTIGLIGILIYLTLLCSCFFSPLDVNKTKSWYCGAASCVSSESSPEIHRCWITSESISLMLLDDFLVCLELLLQICISFFVLYCWIVVIWIWQV